MQDSPKSLLLKDIAFLFLKILIIATVFLITFTFMFGFCHNADLSMAPAMKEGDLLIFYRLDKNYLARDTLILEYQEQMQARRVIAVGGDRVDITEEGLLVNGALLQEPEVYMKTERYLDGTDFPLTVGAGQVFVLGDSRDNATDSRIYGCVNIKDTLGKVMAVVRRRNI